MCGRFQGVPLEVVEQIIRDIVMKNTAALLPDWPAVYPSAYPKSDVALITVEDGVLTAKVMRWGYEVSWGNGIVFNTRADSALKPGHNMWTDSLAKRRCVVPALGFYEPHKSETFINPKSGRENKQQYYFTLPGTQVMFLAGIYEDDHFSVMTTEPNVSARPIHERMPVVLTQGELNTWLYGDYPSLFDRSTVVLSSNKVQ